MEVFATDRNWFGEKNVLGEISSETNNKDVINNRLKHFLNYNFCCK